MIARIKSVSDSQKYVFLIKMIYVLTTIPLPESKHDEYLWQTFIIFQVHQ